MEIEKVFIEKFREILEITDRELLLSDKFREYDEWNSLVFLTLIAMIDEEFEVIIEGKDFKQLETVEDVIQAISERQA